MIIFQSPLNHRLNYSRNSISSKRVSYIISVETENKEIDRKIKRES